MSKVRHIRFGPRGELRHFRRFGPPILPFFLPNIKCPYASPARSVQKPLKVPSLILSEPKPLKVSSLARSVPKPRLGEAGGPQTCHYHRCQPPTSWSSAARYELPTLQS